MRRFLVLTFAALVATSAVADDAAIVAKQKSTAEASFKRIVSSRVATIETVHFILIGSGSDSRLKSLTGPLEKQYTAAVKALQFESKTPWPGKLAIFTVPDPASFKSFVRQVEKRSPRPDEMSSAQMQGESPFVAAVIAKDTAAFDAVVGRLVASVIIQNRAVGQTLPDWLVAGFSQATIVQGTPTGARKRAIIRLNLPAYAAWNADVPAEARHLVSASFVEYLVYGKGIDVSKFLIALRPMEGQEEKPLADVWKDADVSPEKLEAGWRFWLSKS